MQLSPFSMEDDSNAGEMHSGLRAFRLALHFRNVINLNLRIVLLSHKTYLLLLRLDYPYRFTIFIFRI